MTPVQVYNRLREVRETLESALYNERKSPHDVEDPMKRLQIVKRGTHDASQDVLELMVQIEQESIR